MRLNVAAPCFSAGEGERGAWADRRSWRGQGYRVMPRERCTPCSHGLRPRPPQLQRSEKLSTGGNRATLNRATTEGGRSSLACRRALRARLGGWRGPGPAGESRRGPGGSCPWPRYAPGVGDASGVTGFGWAPAHIAALRRLCRRGGRRRLSATESRTGIAHNGSPTGRPSTQFAIYCPGRGAWAGRGGGWFRGQLCLIVPRLGREPGLSPVPCGRPAGVPGGGRGGPPGGGAAVPAAWRSMAGARSTCRAQPAPGRGNSAVALGGWYCRRGQAAWRPTIGPLARAVIWRLLASPRRCGDPKAATWSVSRPCRWRRGLGDGGAARLGGWRQGRRPRTGRACHHPAHAARRGRDLPLVTGTQSWEPFVSTAHTGGPSGAPNRGRVGLRRCRGGGAGLGRGSWHSRLRWARP